MVNNQSKCIIYGKNLYTGEICNQYAILNWVGDYYTGKWSKTLAM